MSASLRAGNSSDGYLQIDGADVVSITASGMAPSSGKTIEATSGPSNSAFSFRNKIINGGFDIWQRGKSFAPIPNGNYSADRWRYVFDGSGTHNTSMADRRNATGYFAFQLYQSAAGSGATYRFLQQKIESATTLAGKTATVSFRARLLSGSGTDFTISVVRYYGTGGSPAPQDTIGTSTTQVLTGSWQTFSYSVAIPDLTGKTLGTDNNDFLDIRVNLPMNEVNIIEIQQFQVEEGSVATPFESRPYGVELALCQRYFYKSGVIRQYAYGTTVNVIYPVTFPVTTRVTPTTLNVYSSVTFVAANIRQVAAGVDKAASITAYGNDGAAIRNTVVLTGADDVSFFYDVSAEL